MSDYGQGSFSINLASLPDRDSVVAEVWRGKHLLAELRREGDALRLQLYPRPNGAPWDVPHPDFVQALMHAQPPLDRRGCSDSHSLRAPLVIDESTPLVRAPQLCPTRSEQSVNQHNRFRASHSLRRPLQRNVRRTRTHPATESTLPHPGRHARLCVPHEFSTTGRAAAGLSEAISHLGE